MNKIEIVGLVASLFIIASLLFKTTSYVQTVCMRCVNIVGSTVFIVYGFMLPAYSTAITNIVATVLSIYNLIYEYIWHKKEKNGTHKDRIEELPKSSNR